MAMCEDVKPGWATFGVISSVLLLKFFGDVNIPGMIVSNPINALYFSVGYLVLGTVWSLAKWWFFVREARESFDSMKKEWFLNRGRYANVPESDEKRNQEFKKHIGSRDFRPKASKEKSRIMTWMCWWPWSFVWTLINDPVKRAFTAIFNKFKSAFDSISNRAFEGTEVEKNDE